MVLIAVTERELDSVAFDPEDINPAHVAAIPRQNGLPSKLITFHPFI
jgi:hypothetical protein